MKRYLKAYWKELTKHMQPWVKWSFGVILFPVCLLLTPVGLLLAFIIFGGAFLEIRITNWVVSSVWWKKAKAVFVKPEDPL